MKNPLVIAGNAILLGGGILLIVIPAIVVGSYWGLLSIAVFCASLIPPILCNACTLTASNHVEAWLFADETDARVGGMLAWTVMGIFVTVGYAIPFEMWRVGRMPVVGMACAMGGGTVILAAIGLFSWVVRVPSD